MRRRLYLPSEESAKEAQWWIYRPLLRLRFKLPQVSGLENRGICKRNCGFNHMDECHNRLKLPQGISREKLGDIVEKNREYDINRQI